MCYFPALLHLGKLIRPHAFLTTHHGYTLTLCFLLSLYKTNLHSSFCVIGSRKAFLIVVGGTSQMKNVVFVSIHTPSFLVYKIPSSNQFFSTVVGLTISYTCFPFLSLTGVFLFSHPPYPLSNFFLSSGVLIQTVYPTALSVSLVLGWLFWPRFFPCWGFSSCQSLSWDGR